MPNAGSKSVIVYAKQLLGGILVRPDSQSVMRRAVQGHPIQVNSGNDYINLFHVFERLVAADSSLANLRLVRRQVGGSRWLLFVVPEKQDAPEVKLEHDYDPKRGRYKRYAEQLAAGDALQFTDKAEAIKARRAWQLYFRGPARKHQRSTVRALGRKPTYVTMIVER